MINKRGLSDAQIQEMIDFKVTIENFRKQGAQLQQTYKKLGIKPQKRIKKRR